MHHILIVDDDYTILKLHKFLLTDEGYTVTALSSPDQALAMIQQHDFALIMLDIMMPQMDGIELCRRIRKVATTPIIFVSVKDAPEDKVLALMEGGDDYIVKPFHPNELLARVVATLRRAGYPVNGDSSLRTVDFSLDPIANQVTLVRTNKRVALTPIEARLLRCFLSNAGRILTRDVLLMNVWGHGYDSGSKLLDVNVKRLRDKIEEDPSQPQLLVTVRTLGYKYQPSTQGTAAGRTSALLSLERGA